MTNENNEPINITLARETEYEIWIVEADPCKKQVGYKVNASDLEILLEYSGAPRA